MTKSFLHFFVGLFSFSSINALFAYRHAARLAEKFEYDAALALLGDYVEFFPSRVEALSRDTLAAKPRNTRAFCLLAKALSLQGKRHLIPAVAVEARNAGLGYAYNNDPFHCAEFFKELVDTFPEMSMPFFMLYDAISSQISSIRITKFTKHEALKPVIISIVIWGKSYENLFLKYFLPSMLSQGNIPGLSKIRSVVFDVYASDEVANSLNKNPPILKRLQKYCNFNIYSFADGIVYNEEIKRDGSMRYLVYGGFHHVSMIRAKKNNADIICIAPDGIHSDGSFTNYIKFLDQGFKAVLFTSTRGQAEVITPFLDDIRDKNDQVISLTPEKIVDLSIKNIHHEFIQYLMTEENDVFPDIFSRWFFINEQGFVSRNFQLHPIAISADALKRDINFSFTTVDDTLISRIFESPDEWKDLKVVADSNDGVMLDLTYAFDPVPKYKTRKCSDDYLEGQFKYFTQFNAWQFSHEIVYKGSDKYLNYRIYEVNNDKSLIPRDIPVLSNLNISHIKLNNWINSVES